MSASARSQAMADPAPMLVADPPPVPLHKGTLITVTTILRRLLGVVLILAGAAALGFGGWFARAVGTSGAATFTTTPPAGLPVVIDAQTSARTDIPLRITATAEDGAPIMVSIASPSDAGVFLEPTRYARVTGIGIRDWVLSTSVVGSGDPVDPAAVDLWRSQTTTAGVVSIDGDLEQAPETIIIITPGGEALTEVSMTWSNTAWFYQALSFVFAGLLAALVGIALIVRRAAEPDVASDAAAPAGPAPTTTDSENPA